MKFSQVLEDNGFKNFPLSDAQLFYKFYQKNMHIKSTLFILIENFSVWMNAHVWLTSEVHSNQGKLIEKLKDGIAIYVVST